LASETTSDSLPAAARRPYQGPAVAAKAAAIIGSSSANWIVVRNRLSMIGSRHRQLVANGLKDLSLRLGFRSIGFAERVVYREFFPRGLTALDDLDEATLGTRLSMGHVTAREEVTSLSRQLKLPLDERGRRRAANGAE
jgi:chromosome partitioning protein